MAHGLSGRLVTLVAVGCARLAFGVVLPEMTDSSGGFRLTFMSTAVALLLATGVTVSLHRVTHQK